MANHKSAIKRDRQNKKRNLRNNAFRTQVKSTTKKVLMALDSKDKVQATEAFQTAEATISKVASKGVIHKRSAARKISQLAKRLNQLTSVS